MLSFYNTRMEAGQSIQVRLQGILRRINSEEIRNRVSGWQRVIASASLRFRSQSEEDVVDATMEGDTKNDLKLLSPVEEHPPRNKSPVQIWVDSLPVAELRKDDEMPPITEVDVNDVEVESFTLGAEAPGVTSPRPYPTFHVTSTCGGSDAGSHCSSMESLLEARKPDPEEILLELGFGGSEEPDMVSRIPTRFLQPSKLKGVSIDEFLKHQQHMVHTFQSGFCGYRGLTGTSHAVPSGIVGKIMDRLREAEAERQHYLHQQQQRAQNLYATRPSCATPGYSPKLAKLAHNLINKIKCVKEVSVLSPENRNWYESQGDKSPEPSNRRIIFGQQSFIFSKDGSLIESSNTEKSTESGSECPSGTESTQGNFSIENIKNGKEGTNFSEKPPDPILTIHNYDKDLLQAEYKSLCSLMSQIGNLAISINLGTEEEFYNLNPEERKDLHVRVIEAALKTYQKRLNDIDLRSHFRDMLDGELVKVTDLLDETSSPSVLAVIKEMTCLLRHQESLRQALNLREDTIAFNDIS